jgi:hypothetical protein
MFRSLSPALRGIILILLSLLLLAGGIVWHSLAAANASMAATNQSPSVADSSSNDGDTSGSGILLGLARDAMHDGRLVAPAGSNAYEFYLSVLQLDPRNRTAGEAMRESFSIAANQIEGNINHQDLDEARREIDLLREFDSTNFTLSLLDGKLAAARKVMTRRHEAEAERIQQSGVAKSP